jgi:hypothetical protein
MSAGYGEDLRLGPRLIIECALSQSINTPEDGLGNQHVLVAFLPWIGGPERAEEEVLD